jgi:hypothetical protein
MIQPMLNCEDPLCLCMHRAPGAAVQFDCATLVRPSESHRWWLVASCNGFLRLADGKRPSVNSARAGQRKLAGLCSIASSSKCARVFHTGEVMSAEVGNAGTRIVWVAKR